MAIQGSLKERSLFELLSSLPKENRSGELTLKRGRKRIVIGWIDNQIVHAVEQPMPKENSLGELLVLMGKIDRVQLNQALKQQRLNLAPLGELLIKLFNCHYTDIQLALRVQAIEILYEGLFWIRGEYSFEAKPIQRSNNHFEPIDISEFLETAFPIIEARPQLEKLFSSPELRVEALGDSLPSGLSLTEGERHLFELLKERPYRFGELAVVSGLGRLPTAYGLYNLYQNQLLVIKPPEKKKIDFTQLFLGSTVTEFFTWIVGTILIAAIASYLLLFAPYSPLQRRDFGRLVPVTHPHWEDISDHWRKKHIEFAIQVYYLLHRRYPPTLHALVKSKLIAPEFIRDPKGFLYDYYWDNFNFKVESSLK